MATNEKILKSIKKMLNLPETYTPFDDEVKIFINSALARVSQLGVGPEIPIQITTGNETWADLYTDPIYAPVKNLVFMQVKLSFDPPSYSFHVKALEDEIAKTESLLNTFREVEHAKSQTPE